MTSSLPPGDGAETAADAVRRAVIGACNHGSLDALDALLAGGSLGPVERLREMVVRFRAAAPDARCTVEEQIAQGETVVTRLRVEGRFSGPLLGLTPPGRWASVSGVVITRFAGGRLSGVWVQADLLGLLLQLEVMPQLDLHQALTVARVSRLGEGWIGE